MRRRYVPIGIVAAIVGGLTIAWALPSAHLPGHVQTTKLDQSVSWNTAIPATDADCRAKAGGDSEDPLGPGISPAAGRATFDIGDLCSSFVSGSLNLTGSMIYDGYWSTESAVPNNKPGWKIQGYTLSADAGSDPLPGNVNVQFASGVCGEVPDGTSGTPAVYALQFVHAGNYAFSVTIDLVPSTAWSAGACPTSF